MLTLRPIVTIGRAPSQAASCPTSGTSTRVEMSTKSFEGNAPVFGRHVVPAVTTMTYPTTPAPTGISIIWNTGTKPTRPKERWM